MKDIKIWWIYTTNSFQQMLTQRITVVIFLFGKSLRIVLFLIFLSFLFNGAKSLAGYNKEQIIFFYLSFNLIDTLGQLFFREVYRFRPLIISGNFDLILAKPMNPMIRVLLGGADFLDLLMLFLIAGLTIWFVANNIPTNLGNVVLYLLLIFNGFIISAAFHIFTMGLGVTTTSIDHLIAIYRDFTSMLRIPVDLYTEPFRMFLTFIIPLGIMITFPAKVLLGLLSPQLIVISLLLSFFYLYLAVSFWNHSLKQYASASS